MSIIELKILLLLSSFLICISFLSIYLVLFLCYLFYILFFILLLLLFKNRVSLLVFLYFIIPNFYLFIFSFYLFLLNMFLILISFLVYIAYIIIFYFILKIGFNKFMNMIFILLLFFFSLDTILSVLYYSFFTTEKIYVIFYFIKYDFHWIAKVFWFKIAVGGIVLMFVIIYIVAIIEIDPTMRPNFDRLEYWFYKDFEKHIDRIIFILFRPYYILGDYFSIQGNFLFDHKVIMRYGVLLFLCVLFNFILCSFFSIWIRDAFIYVLNFELNEENDFYLCLKVLKYTFIYVMVLIIFINIYTAITSIFIIVFIISVVLESRFLYGYTHPEGWATETIQEGIVNYFDYSFLTYYQFYFYNNSRFINNDYIMKLPEKVDKESKLYVLNKSDLEIRLRVISIIRDLDLFFYEVKSEILINKVVSMCKWIEGISESQVNVLEYLMLLKVFIIKLNIYSKLDLEIMVDNVNEMEFYYWINFKYKCYSFFIVRYDFNISKIGIIFNSRLFYKINRFNFYSIVRYNENNNLLSLSLFREKELYYKDLVIGYEFIFRNYFIKAKDLKNKNLSYLNNLYMFIKFIMSYSFSNKQMGRVYVSKSLNLKVKIIISGLILGSKYKVLNGLYFRRKDFYNWDYDKDEEVDTSKMKEMLLLVVVRFDNNE